MMKNILFYFAALVLIWACDTKNNTTTPIDSSDSSTVVGPVDPVPADGAIGVDNLVNLSWTYDEADTFRVLLDTANPPQKIEKDSLYANSLTTFVQGTGAVYYWQVIAVFSDGTEVPSDIWSFATSTSASIEQGYQLINHWLVRITPNRIRVLFQVLDRNGNGVTSLVQDDFKFFEDGELISPYESELTIGKSPIIPELNTLLMLDNSSSITGNDPQNLTTIKNTATEIVNNMTATQYTGVYKFSSSTDEVIGYTDITGQQAIINAINSIPQGASSTDLYGAVIKGSSKLTERYTAQIVQSFMVVITDGEDTQGSHVFADALDAATGKNVYTVGVGSAIDMEVLYLLGNKGYYRIDQNSQIDSVVAEIQSGILQLADSFYELEYASPKRGNVEHFVELFINGNKINSTLQATYTSADFFDPEPGIYFNSSFGEPEGDDRIEITSDGIADTVIARSYGGSTVTEPVYTWTTDNSLNFTFLDSNNSTVEVSSTAAAVSGQTIAILVSDTVNGFSKTINFVIL